MKGIKEQRPPNGLFPKVESHSMEAVNQKRKLTANFRNSTAWGSFVAVSIPCSFSFCLRSLIGMISMPRPIIRPVVCSISRIRVGLG